MPTLSPYETLVLSIRKIIHNNDLRSKKNGKVTGLTTPQQILMQTLQQQSPCYPSDLARAMMLSQATITNILQRLEQRELIRRVKSAGDKRKVSVALTEHGKEMLAKTPALTADDFATRFHALDVWQQEALVGALATVANLMETPAENAAKETPHSSN